MPFDPDFRALPGGEELIRIPEEVLKTMSTDQRISYSLVEAVKKGILPEELQEILCGPLCHARFITISFAMRSVQSGALYVISFLHFHSTQSLTSTGGSQRVKELYISGRGSTA